jgi:hypothetical protein
LNPEEIKELASDENGPNRDIASGIFKIENN